jgi:curved DNA-binding protein CbpA
MNFYEFSVLLENEMNRSIALRILGLTQEFNFELLKKRYIELSLKNHPDKGGDPNEFKKITRAFKYLEENPPDNKKIEDLKKKYPEIAGLFRDDWKRSENLTTPDKWFLKTQKANLLRTGYLKKEALDHVKEILSKIVDLDNLGRI